MEGGEDTLNAEENICDNNNEEASCSSNLDDTYSCQFLKCNPKEKEINYVEVVDETINSTTIDDDGFNVCGNEEEVDQQPSNSDQRNDDKEMVEELKNEIFAKQDENGCWLLRWNVDRRSENDFIGLCFEGKI